MVLGAFFKEKVFEEKATALRTLQARKRDGSKVTLLLGRGSWEEALLPTKGQSGEMGLSQTQVRRLGDGRGGNRTTCSGRWRLCRTFSLRVTKLM